MDPAVKASGIRELGKFAKVEFEMVEYLIRRGATLSTRTTKGKTALHLAVIATDLPIAACLLEHGARIDARDRNNATPLHYAVSKNNARIAELLISKGSRTNVRDSLGKTPLDIARIQKFPSLIELLEAATQPTKRPDRPSLFRSASLSHKTEDLDEASPKEAKRHKH